MGQISRKLKIFILQQLYSEKFKFQSSWSSHPAIFSFIKEREKEDRETLFYILYQKNSISRLNVQSGMSSGSIWTVRTVPINFSFVVRTT